MRQSIGWIAIALIALLTLAITTWALWPAPPAPQATLDAPAPPTQPDGLVEGRVLGPDGQPLPGAEVSAAEQRVSADAQGRFSLGPLPIGAHRIDAAAPDMISPGSPDQRGRVVEIVQGAGPIRQLDLVLRRPATITGRVVAGGTPVANARIGMLYRRAEGLGGALDPFALDGLATTDAQGTFTLTQLAPGSARVLVQADAFALAESRELRLGDGQQLRDLTIDLAPSARATARVVDTDGEPLVGVMLALVGGSMREVRARTDAQGSATFSQLPPGELTLIADAPGFRQERVALTAVAAEPVEVDVVMERAAGLFGRVVTPEGQPPSSATVIVQDGERFVRAITTDAQGNFQWDPQGPGSFTLSAQAPTHGPSPTSPATPGSAVTLTLAPGGRILGRVVDERGQPLAAYSLNVEDLRVEGRGMFGPRAHPAQQITRADGAFTMGPLRPGTYYLRAAPDSMAPASSGPIEVFAGRDTSGVTLRVSAGVALTGTVRDPRGAPLAGASVALMVLAQNSVAKSTLTDAQGRYKLEGVGPGRQTIRVSKEGFMTELASGVDVPLRAEARRDVTLTASSPDAQFSFHGIGATLGQDPRGPVIRDVMEGSPASTYGLRAGDVILSVDGSQAKALSLQDVIARIRGQEGVAVNLVVEREGHGRVVVDVERGRVVVREQQRPRSPVQR